jgi:LPXTG-motif cell wall-anchored protein
MGKIVNKRNALLGWFTWRIGKRVARKKARSAVPAVEGGRPNRPAIATGIAALGGALFFWRRKRRRASAGGDATGES